MSPLEMQKFATNPVMDKFKAGKAAVGSWLSLCSPIAAESMAQVGWDWLAINAEHSPIGFESLVNSFRAVQLGGAAPIARVPYNDPTWIQRVLDAGALGITVPTISTAEQAEQVVKNARYYATGHRSYGPTRVAPYIEGDYRTWTEKNLVIIAMIESIEGVENAESIFAVEGITGALIGPNDLAISMGYRPQDQGPGTEHEAACMRVLAAAKKMGKVAGKNCYTSEEVTTRIAQGFQFLSISSDAGYMAKAAQETFDGIDMTGGAD